ncbi:aspartate kinase, partial [Vibrio parahaemolyticus]|nr:aspartate kinase [Vibrio parahaemolyticus]
GIMIKQDACAKFDLVFSDKIRNSEVVSLLTAVGLEANGMVEHACDLLAKRDIEINFSATNALTMMLVLAPECVDTAANILHDAYIT